MIHSTTGISEKLQGQDGVLIFMGMVLGGGVEPEQGLPFLS